MSGARGTRPSSAMRVSMSYALISRNSSRDLLERRRSPGVHARPQSGCPRQQDQVAVVGVVVRVMVGDEDVPQLLERPGDHELPGNPVAAVDDVRRTVDDDHLRRRSWPSWPWSAAGAKQDQPCLIALSLTPARSPCPRGQRGGGVRNARRSMSARMSSSPRLRAGSGRSADLGLRTRMPCLGLARP